MSAYISIVIRIPASCRRSSIMIFLGVLKQVSVPIVEYSPGIPADIPNRYSSTSKQFTASYEYSNRFAALQSRPRGPPQNLRI